MKICSLLPSSTEILYALGLGHEVVGVTHECDYPPSAREKPTVTSSVLDRKDLSGETIDRLIREELSASGSIYHLDAKLLRELAPDLIITQELCDVCAVAYPEVQRAAQEMEHPAKVMALEPTTLEEVWKSIEIVGNATGRLDRANAYVKQLRSRVHAIAERVKDAAERPRVLCLEWINPPFCSGHWIPEMTAIAGGIEGLGKVGKPATQIAWQQIEACQPEIIVIMPCGFGLTRVREEFDNATLPDLWKELPAVQTGRVYLVDGNAYFNRPGPRLVESLELLAHLIHPNLFVAPLAAPEDAFFTIKP